MSERLNQATENWPLRPWIMAAICAAAGLIFHLLTDRTYPATVPVLNQAAATFVAIAALSFVLTVERVRLAWALAFAAGWGLVLALVGWFTARYNLDATIFEWPYLSGIFAVMLAAPLFQTVRDEGAWRFPYGRLHSHAWTDAVIGAAALFFTGVVFLLAWLIAGLFNLIGIEVLKDLLNEDWFGWVLAGFAFGAAVGMLRERDGLVATLQKLVMVVFSVLAPVLAVALVAFLASVPFTGLGKLWDSWVPATPLLLTAGAGAILLANAVIGDGRDERSSNRILHWSALALTAVILPLAIIAALSMQARIGQYGWTPERIWGVIAVGVAIAYGLAGWWSIWRGRQDFDDPLRPAQVKMAIGLCAIALILALPVVDFGAISARSQLARLQSGKVEAAKFDWRAMAFDFGPAGRKRLARITRSGPADQRTLARTALASKNRYDIESEVKAAADVGTLDTKMRVVPAGRTLPQDLRLEIAKSSYCGEWPCVVAVVDDQTVIVAGQKFKDGSVTSDTITRLKGEWSMFHAFDPQEADRQKARFSPDIARAPVEIRTVGRKQLFIDGKPVGDAFE